MPRRSIAPLGSSRPFPRAAGALLLLLGAACASANISSIVAPESAGHRYKSVLVLAPFGDIGTRRSIEDAFQAWNKDSGTSFIAAYRIFFPGRSYTSAEVAQVLRTNHVDATLLLEPQSSTVSTAYVPPTLKLNCTQWMSATGCVQTPATPPTVDAPWATFSARLFDAGTGAVAWIATGSGGGTLGNADALHRAIARRAVGQLMSDSLVIARSATATDSSAAARAAQSADENSRALGRPTP